MNEAWNKSKYWLMGIVLTLGGVGCLLLFLESRRNPSNAYYYTRQMVSLAIGLAAYLLCCNVPRKILVRATPWLAALGVVALGAVLLFGSRINGMRGWFRYGAFSMQPSELCKPLFVLWNGWIALKFKDVKPKAAAYYIALATAIPWLVLIALEPDFGTTLIYFITFIGIQFGRGIPKRHLAIWMLAAALCAFAMLKTHPYAARRITSFFSNSSIANERGNWHNIQMQKCLRNGGWTGLPRQALRPQTPVPYRANDSLFAFAAEQLGLMGILPMLLLPLAWLGYCCRKSVRTRDLFSQIVFIGAGVMISAQTLVHLAVNTGLLPTTGITMPLFSYGGSSLMAVMLTVAITQSAEE